MRNEKALENRKLQMITAQGLPNEQAISLPGFYPKWNGGGIHYGGTGEIQIVSYVDKLYRCISPHTSQEDWKPGTAPSLWVEISDPAIEWPEWKQPQGAHDAYAKGAKVTHAKKRWTSDVDGNVWQPGVSSWTAQ